MQRVCYSTLLAAQADGDRPRVQKPGAEGNKLLQSRGRLRATANPTFIHLHIVAGRIKQLPLCSVIWEKLEPKRNSFLGKGGRKKNSGREMTLQSQWSKSHSTVSQPHTTHTHTFTRFTSNNVFDQVVFNFCQQST